MVAFLNVNGGTEIQWNAERNPPQRFITQFKYRDKIVIVKYTITNLSNPRRRCVIERRITVFWSLVSGLLNLVVSKKWKT
jgi:hypothetical protein